MLMKYLTRENSLFGHVHAYATFEVAFEGHDGSPQEVLPEGRDLEGALLLLLQVVNVCTNLLHTLNERLHILVVQVTA